MAGPEHSALVQTQLVQGRLVVERPPVVGIGARHSDGPRPSLGAPALATRPSVAAVAPGTLGTLHVANLQVRDATVQALEFGRRAATAIMDSRQADSVRPCAACCALRVPSVPARRHTPAACFKNICCSCLRTSRYVSAASAERPLENVCSTPSAECRNVPPPWIPVYPEEGEPEGSCTGCGLPPSVVIPSVGVFGLHAQGQRGNLKCPWAFTIRVAMLQMARARTGMAMQRPLFSVALQQRCHIAWTWPEEALGAEDAVRRCVRLPPRNILDWGDSLDGVSSRSFAQWLTSGTTLPNVVFFAPVLAKALGVLPL